MSEISSILNRLDELFSIGDTKKIQCFLEEQIRMAIENGETDNLITLLNEMIGFCRDMGFFDIGDTYCEKLLTLVEGDAYKDTIAYATTLLNIGNFKRAKKEFEVSEECYQKVLPIYKKFLALNDFRYASFYNNYSLLKQEMGKYEDAIECLKKALSVAVEHENARIEVATTYTNLANCYLKLFDTENAEGCLNKAFSIFEKDEKRDYHYGGALSAMAEVCVQSGEYTNAVEYYERTLKHLEIFTGKDTPQYQVVLSNLEKVKKLRDNSGDKAQETLRGLSLCREYYLTYGKPMLTEKFSEYMDRITVGLVGEGSDCFGFDDTISKDHDFGPRFCMWVSKETYEEIGEKLQNAYKELPNSFQNVTRNMSAAGTYRQGVIVLEDFLEHLLFTKYMPITENDWLMLPENGLAALQNGEIWHVGDGEFDKIREKLKQYPSSVRYKKIATSLHLVRQSGAYNYFRMKERREWVAAMLCLSTYMENVMKVVYYINYQYPPFYKWLHKGMDKFEKLAEIMDILNALYDYRDDDATVKGIFEVIDTLLEHELSIDRENLIEEIVQMEWEAFDKVENKGGRADCQDDYGTFYIMRKSQYMTWNKELLLSFLKDLKAAKEVGWNMISEKYARMMESTFKEEYEKLKDKLPFVSDEKKTLVEQIVKIQVDWMESFAEEYPNVAKNARVIHTSEDTYFSTSYETYLRGELLTYSDETLKLYGQFIVSLAKENQNLAKMIMENTSKLYGYSSLMEI